MGNNGHAVELDLASADYPDRWYLNNAGIYEKHASRLVFASGITSDLSVDDTGPRTMSHMFAVNAEGPVLFVNVISGFMADQGAGPNNMVSAVDPSIVALSTVAARGSKHLQAYAMSKAALEAGFVNVGVERGISVRSNALALDYVAGTDMWEKEDERLKAVAAKKVDERGELMPEIAAKATIRVLDSRVTRKIITLSHMKKEQDLRHMNWKEFEVEEAKAA